MFNAPSYRLLVEDLGLEEILAEEWNYFIDIIRHASTRLT